jgi:phosphoribosylamine-glycine ligase
MPSCHFKGSNIWILKPTSLNRGKGIHVISSFKKLKRLIRDYCRGKEQQPISPTKDDARLTQTTYGQ